MCCKKQYHTQCDLIVALRREYCERYNEPETADEPDVLAWARRVVMIEDILLHALGVTPNILRGK